MRDHYRYVIVLLLVAMSFYAHGQERNFPLGKSPDFLKSLQAASRSSAQRGGGTLALKVAEGQTFPGRVNHRESSGAERDYFVGAIEGVEGSSFYIRVDGSLLEGNIVLRKSKQAYRYFSDAQGNAYVKEVDINEVICIDFNKSPEKNTTGARAQASAITAALLTLESYPGANGCVLLDFDGQYVSGTLWNNGNPINAAPATQTDAQIQEIWEMISEDFRPFHVNITTNEAVFNSYPMNRRMRCIFTPTNTAAPGAGGVAYVGSFSWNNDTPCWVFNGGAKGAGEAGSHEIGHTFSLGHDGRTTPKEDYFGGHGSWAPIMGVGYGKTLVQWSKGEYTAANNTEDDLAKISSSTHGVGYRADDRGNTLATASAIVTTGSGSVPAAQNYGVIDRSADVDMFSFTTGGGTITLNFSPASRHADLDILATLYNSSGTVLATSNPSALSATIISSLGAGTYYVSVAGTGAGNPASDGYSRYASLGYYSISGTIPPVPAAAGATLFQHCGFSTAGYAVTLGPGNYTTAQLVAQGILNNDVSSLRVQNGYEVVLYKGDNFQGAYAGFTSDVDCLTAYTLNDSTSSLRVRSVSNALPVVSLSAPSSGSTYVAPATITISANASDGDGAISKVEFFQGTVKLGERTAAPYSFSWTSVGAGSYTITATATDDRGGKSSAQAHVTVNSVGAIVYKDCNYGGYAVNLTPGNYTLAQLTALGVLNNDISSLRVTPGYEMILYSDDNFQGNAYLFRSDFSCLVTVVVNGTTINLNDWASSLVVRATTTAAVSEAARIASAETTPRLSVTVSPNPFTDKVSVSYDGNPAATLQVAVYSLEGTTILPFHGVTPGELISLQELTPGVYVLKVSDGESMVTRRIIKR